MSAAKEALTIGELIRKEIDAGCDRLQITRGSLADRVGMNRVSLYNLIARPAGISLQSLIKIMEVLEIPRERQGYLVFKWCEDRTDANQFVALLFPVLRDLARRAGVDKEAVGQRILAVYAQLRPEA